MENQVPTTTLSITRKVNLGNYESEDVFINLVGLTAETTEEEIEKLLSVNETAYRIASETLRGRVQAIKSPKTVDEPKNGKAYGPAPAAQPSNGNPTCPFKAKAKKIADDHNFSTSERMEFETICINRNRDFVKTIISAQEDGCTSYDEFVAFAATDTKPENAKPRLEIAK